MSWKEANALAGKAVEMPAVLPAESLSIATVSKQKLEAKVWCNSRANWHRTGMYSGASELLSPRVAGDNGPGP
ncbi:unnamed protein product [Lota lota]